MRNMLIMSFLLGLGLLVLFAYQYLKFHDGKLHVVFCNVGQGDGIFIRTPSGKDVIVDGGPDDAILSCLSSHMPFWDRSIELMVLSHPHADHLNGLISVIQRYSLKYFSTEDLRNDTAGFTELGHLLTEKKIARLYVEKGDGFDLKDGVKIKFVAPTSDFITSTSPNGKIGESKEFASVETLLSYGNFHSLFTGDSQATELSEGAEGIEELTVLQIPHHGSKTGINRELLAELSPDLAVISVGKNKYGHPAPEILRVLSETRTRFIRTDEHGDIEIVSDGKKWSVN